MAHLQMALSSCRQLQQLRIIRRWDGVYEFGNTAVVFDPQYWQDLTALISQNPELKVIGFNLCCRVEFPATFWRAIANVPQIQTLSIHGAVINGQETEVVDAFLDACLAVESLHLDYTLFKEPIRSERWANCKRFPRLAILNFFGRTLLDMDFFAKCLAAPGLKRVRWSTEHSDKYLPSTMASQVSQHIVNARLGSLTGLELWDGMPFTDEDICAVLDSLTSPLIELSVSESGFGEMSLASLLRQPSLQNTTQNMLGQGESSTTLDVRYGQRAPHCTKLQIIDLTDCPDVTDEMAELIRESCPHLKTLSLK
ncbi:hypothetical protein BGZ58_003720 [Dissophora ornata]|nr:hypothetical protein BGZ58_003720 [Dissophora ornata]